MKQIKKLHKKDIGFIVKAAISSILIAFAAGCACYVCVMQSILKYEKFGAIIGGANVFIPDKSALWLIGIVAVVPALLIFIIGGEKHEQRRNE